MNPVIAVALIAAPIVIGVVVGVIWSRRIDQARKSAIAAMEARRAPRQRPQWKHKENHPPYVKPRPASAEAWPSSRSYDAPAPLPLPVDSWLGSAPAESHHSSLSGGGGTFDGGGSSGDWSSSSSDSSSSHSSSDSSSSDSGSCGGGD